MIPEAFILAWQSEAPWPERDQVEQDLLLSRAMIELFSDDILNEKLLFRGGTAIYKLHVDEAVRYSEDLDLVMIDKGPIGPIYDAIRDKLDPLLGEPKRDQKESMATMTYSFNSEFPPQSEQSLKIEINYEEDFSVLEPVKREYRVENPWFSGAARIPTFKPDELLGSKLRALFQRRKGRDLFDLWFTLTRKMVEPAQVLACFEQYTSSLDTPITRARFEKNLTKKLNQKAFLEDTESLIAKNLDYDIQEAARLVYREIIEKIPGAPYRGEDNIFK